VTVVATKTDVGATEWVIDDAVTRLRVWGTDRHYDLAANGEATIGSATSCSIRLVDPAEQVSREHARLVREGERLFLRDLGSKNGIRLDGARRNEFIVEPGVELGIGGLTLIAESPRLIALREFLARILGWSGERIEAVDLALRAVRVAASRRAPLVLAGDGDLIPIARAIHVRARGAERPFVLCDPRRRRGEATVRSAENYDLGMPAFAAATGGSLCVWSHRTPSDFGEVRAALRDPSHRVQLIACAQRANEAEQFAAYVVDIPALTSRAGEIDRIVAEFGADATAMLGAAFTKADREWVREHSSASLTDIEKGTLRLVALREGGSVARAASLLGMSHVALAEWIGRRRLPHRRQR
jgi:hypothetical protein